MDLRCLLGMHEWTASANGEKCSKCSKTVEATYVCLTIADLNKLTCMPALVVVVANSVLPQAHKAGIRQAIRIRWRGLSTNNFRIAEGIDADDVARCIAVCHREVSASKGGGKLNLDAYMTEGVYNIPGTRCIGRVFYWKEGY